MELYNNLKHAHGGIVVENEMIYPRAKFVTDIHDTNNEFEVEPVDLSKD
jgi:hypothetical protein